MSSDETLSLEDALKRWSDPHLVERVKMEERRLSEYELDGTSRIQLTPRTERRQPTATSWKIDTDLTVWLAAWHDLERAFRNRIERGAIHVRGVQVAPERKIEPDIVPGAWAADFVFDFGKGTIKVGDRRFAAIACSLKPWDAGLPTLAQPAPSVVTELRPEDVPHFTDDFIFALLEEHARRVAMSADAKLFPPGKTSLMPMIKRRMEARAAQGVLSPKLANEAAVLALWIKDKLPSHSTPTAKSIENVLRSDYSALRARSNPTIP